MPGPAKQYPKPIECFACEGHGSYRDDRDHYGALYEVRCEFCNGEGRVIPCEHCGGVGEIPESNTTTECPECHGHTVKWL